MTTRLSTSDIATRIGLPLAGAFIVDVLGVPFQEKIKKGMYWDEIQYPAICHKLAEYAVNRIREPLAAKPATVTTTPPATVTTTPPETVGDDDLSVLG